MFCSTWSSASGCRSSFLKMRGTLCMIMSALLQIDTDRNAMNHATLLTKIRHENRKTTLQTIREPHGHN